MLTAALVGFTSAPSTPSWELEMTPAWYPIPDLIIIGILLVLYVIFEVPIGDQETPRL